MGSFFTNVHIRVPDERTAEHLVARTRERVEGVLLEQGMVPASGDTSRSSWV